MKTKSTIKKIAQIAIVMLFSASVAVAQSTSTPEIKINKIPPLGQEGNAEGQVVWSKLTPEKTEQYAVIAMVHATWPGGGGYYVKPYNHHYLNQIEPDGSFSIEITTGPNDDYQVKDVTFYFVKRAGFKLDLKNVNPTMMDNKYLAKKWSSRK